LVQAGEDAKRLGCMKPEDKVAIAIGMTEACVRVCKAGIRAKCPGASEAELIEKLRKRLEWQKSQGVREA
jgi:hypothetical protein